LKKSKTLPNKKKTKANSLMKIGVQIEHRASSSRGEHEGESSFGLCDRLSRTRDNSQRQLPTDQDYAVSTREYQTDQSSLKSAPTAARSVLEQRRKQQQQTPDFAVLTRSLHIRPRNFLPTCLIPQQATQAWLYGLCFTNRSQPGLSGIMPEQWKWSAIGDDWSLRES
jgi:hypothetical protein